MPYASEWKISDIMMRYYEQLDEREEKKATDMGV
jgi:hypothetical protein